jgi:5'-AMP-activated protein kinase regulatory beta subunit
MEAPRETAVVPTVLQWSQGGHSVYVTGSFNAWGERIPLRRSGNDCVVCLNLLPGTYQYKFIVDNEWRFAADQPTVRDEMGNINNCITVEDQSIFMREEQPSGFFDNNQNMYTQSLPDEITLAKEPPQAPSHLWCLPLNFPSLHEPGVASETLLPPLGVTITHLTMMEAPHTNTLAVTHRVRTKCVTIIFVKPVHQAPPIGGLAGPSASIYGVPDLPPHQHGGAVGGRVSYAAAGASPQPPLQQPMDMGDRGHSTQSLMDVG